VGDQFGEADKQFYLSLTDHDVQHKVRELNANRIGQLVRITGQVRKKAQFFSSVADPGSGAFLPPGSGSATLLKI
jgi:DNA replicative helicase MCM subunit Mcm2 (Cdc46/Mcm family)